jgi:hypothetical protein
VSSVSFSSAGFLGMPQVFQHLPKGQATSPKPTSSTVTGRFQSVVGLQRQGRDQKQYSAALRKRLVGDSTMGRSSMLVFMFHTCTRGCLVYPGPLSWQLSLDTGLRGLLMAASFVASIAWMSFNYSYRAVPQQLQYARMGTVRSMVHGQGMYCGLTLQVVPVGR